MAGLPAMFALLVGAVLLFLALVQVRWRRGCRTGAAKIYREVTEMYRGEHEYRVVSETDFSGADLSGYRRVRGVLLSAGFRHLGCYENLTVSRVHPDHRTFLDAYGSADGMVGAVTYRVVERQTVDFGTSLADGRFLVTTNAELDTLKPPPQVDKCTLPSETAVEVLLARHLERLAALRAREPGVPLLKPSSLDDVIALSRAHSRLVSDYRRSVGFLTEEEMLSFAQRRDQEPTARRIWAEFRQLREVNRDVVEEEDAAGGGRLS